MNSLDIIRAKIQKLYHTNPKIHINVAMTSPKIVLKEESVVIKGVYPHIFQIETQNNGSSKTYTLQYTDVLLHHIDILELEEN